ncbi:MAG: helix-turn-helix domain-containing protein [Gammaproteobacteria bacterium]|jgi:DNA-binding transcriptional regulator YdaS (Cro superfamily)|uniref:helix-turn-helix domain-containing protein n=1 Tax=unclassified Marinomonas TaxID=196814 RepID=UPI000C1EFB11|nr:MULTISPECIES: helix-turn-helix domain-containing protein [unclassified Marinomonas]MBU1296223.1 helix-turn-helix domain-containing protein [Gammaproteobacteria bacterium]MBU1466060.1 helix-turn-helix domain-containing protein [Gammaproteobacteria bacterium]MBU2023182.1 helix-turn-helix domain-containing protein [Gammaproteobacteria bacterium]MBU2240060.1 helix-turn-helix domain-containing protein [Gammaproteobacteria bacterium]MBU2319863.1 helix-turn-helix domain-containing protein [Gammapr
MSAIAKAVEIVGSQTALAQILGVKQAHVWNWLHIHKRSPAKYIRRISLATAGEVSESDLLRDHEL